MSLSRALRLGPAAVVVLGLLVRLTYFGWAYPWEPHHPDEHILPLEGLAMWEGVVPREVGWPASTARLAVSTSEAMQWFIEEGRNTWQLRHQPDRALKGITTWIARQSVETASLYRIGRWTSLVAGMLQLLAMLWALRRWVGPGGATAGMLAIALSPQAVLHSQYVLADIFGLLAATVVVGLAARPSRGPLLMMGAWVGLAAASKFHFGIWLLTPILCIWMAGDGTIWQRVRLTIAVVSLSLAVVLALIPWLWINPVLGLKEVIAVVIVKIVDHSVASTTIANVSAVFGGLGVIAWLGAIVGLATAQDQWRRLGPMVLTVLVAAVTLATSGVVFDRYGLVLLPGLAVLAAIGWERGAAHAQRTIRIGAAALLVVAVVTTSAELFAAERRAGEVDVDVEVKHWILSHVARGQRIGLWDEDNAFLPRTQEQLRACVAYVDTPAAYREKWIVEGFDWPSETSPSMASVVLNDERFFAYWCQRELDAQTDPGFVVVSYHDSLRFGASLERDVFEAFRAGSTSAVDVLVTNRPIDAGRPPTQVFRTERGQRVIYTR